MHLSHQINGGEVFQTQSISSIPPNVIIIAPTDSDSIAEFKLYNPSFRLLPPSYITDCITSSKLLPIQDYLKQFVSVPKSPSLKDADKTQSTFTLLEDRLLIDLVHEFESKGMSANSDGIYCQIEPQFKGKHNFHALRNRYLKVLQNSDLEKQYLLEKSSAQSCASLNMEIAQPIGLGTPTKQELSQNALIKDAGSPKNDEENGFMSGYAQTQMQPFTQAEEFVQLDAEDMIIDSILRTQVHQSASKRPKLAESQTCMEINIDTAPLSSANSSQQSSSSQRRGQVDSSRNEGADSTGYMESIDTSSSQSPKSGPSDSALKLFSLLKHKFPQYSDAVLIFSLYANSGSLEKTRRFLGKTG